MIGLELLLLSFLIFCAVATVLCRRLVSAVIIFMSYSAVMSILWVFAGVAGSGHYRGRRGRGSDQPAVFPHAAEDQCPERNGTG